VRKISRKKKKNIGRKKGRGRGGISRIEQTRNPYYKKLRFYRFFKNWAKACGGTRWRVKGGLERAKNNSQPRNQLEKKPGARHRECAMAIKEGDY